MVTMRFSLAGVASREAETGSWIRTIVDCLGIRMFSKIDPSVSTSSVGWDTTKQKEIQDLHHYAVRNLIPKAGVYQMELLESLAQSASIYSPEEVESLYNETSKKIEEISSHISGVLVSARELCKSGHQNWESVQSLRYHVNRLRGIVESA
ncbi:hypothetical protein [Parabacteroides faecis]|uniref:Uncharacterized protein n=1 Tax=Parabacteroides faecis TaxID=1217282 RepID=A0ABR6KIY2_9BACT|nr:hypothetical protein [Parabacteroides faecis]MBB4621467.1 hypothetical protein [Parabacteroides faecis]MCS2892921.1 hypothetical protein [Parabacteroides faecis]UVQ48471.1 hypothetical protein NXY11_09705 [Parabacteroides faecis]GGJ85675.1 hypothetical protein GCM10007084_06650 [Parabacteroides faecis]